MKSTNYCLDKPSHAVDKFLMNSCDIHVLKNAFAFCLYAWADTSRLTFPMIFDFFSQKPSLAIYFTLYI